MIQATIREVQCNETEAYHDFLSTGLVQDEESFRITAADDRNAPLPTTGTEDSFTLVACVSHQWAGVVSFSRDGINREKLRHKGILFRMYVAPAFRGLGIAQQLIGNLLSRARQLPGIEQITLTVLTNNSRARILYEQFGFRTYGTEPNSLKWKGKYYEEELMVVFL